MAITLPVIHDPATATFIARRLLEACARSSVTAMTTDDGGVVGFVVPVAVFTMLAQWAAGSSAVWSGVGERLSLGELWSRWPEVWRRGYGAAPVMITRWDRPFAFVVFDLRLDDVIGDGVSRCRASSMRASWGALVDVLDTVESVWLLDVEDRPVVRLISLGGYVRRYCGQDG